MNELRVKQRASPPPGDDPLEFIMSDGSVDRMGDVIEQDGWKLDNFRSNPVALFSHNPEFPIGTWKNVGVRDGQLTGRLELMDPVSERLREVHAAVNAGVLRAVSVGFRAIDLEPIEVGSSADGESGNGSLVWHQAEGLTHGDGQRGDIVEEDDGIDSESLGEKRSPGGQFDVFGEFVERQARPQLVELWVPASCLAHRPDWRTLDVFALGGANKQMFLGGRHHHLQRARSASKCC